MVCCRRTAYFVGIHYACVHTSGTGNCQRRRSCGRYTAVFSRALYRYFLFHWKNVQSPIVRAFTCVVHKKTPPKPNYRKGGVTKPYSSAGLSTRPKNKRAPVTSSCIANKNG